jgi:5-methylcytosine-specific restriction endonuclease McrA
VIAIPRKIPTYRPHRTTAIPASTPKRPPSPFYSRRAWRGSESKAGVREIKLAQDPLCEKCKERGELTPAVHVHHEVEVKRDESLALDLGNLVSLCHSCHSSITAKTTPPSKVAVDRGG